MKKILTLMLLTIFSVTLVFSVSYSDSLTAKVTGTIGFEYLTIKLLDLESSQEVSLVDFANFGELNTEGFLVSPRIFEIVYNYNKPASMANSIVQMEVSSEGLTNNGGVTFPIKVLLVDPTNPELEIIWEQIEIQSGEVAEYEKYQDFKIKLIKAIDYEIPIGAYTGSLAFLLVSV